MNDRLHRVTKTTDLILPKYQKEDFMNVKELTGTIAVTPEMAQEILQSHNTKNRTIRMHKVRDYAQKMKNGEWGRTNDDICFDSDGILSNGQHRLMAVVQSGITVKMDFKQDVPQSVYMDRPQTRSLLDNIELETGERYNRVFLAVANAIGRQAKNEHHNPIEEDTMKLVRYIAKLSKKVPDIPPQGNKTGYGSDYWLALTILLTMEEFTPSALEHLHDMFVDNKLPDTEAADNLRILRDKVVGKKDMFRKNRHNPADIAYKRGLEYLKVYVPYLRNQTKKLSKKEAETYFKEALKVILRESGVELNSATE